MNAGSLAVILPAAGQSTRFGNAGNKLLATLGDRPVILHALQAFLARPDVAAIIVPTFDPPFLKEFIERCSSHPLDPRIRFIPGGQTRAHSVQNALRALPPNLEWIAIHDAARP